MKTDGWVRPVEMTEAGPLNYCMYCETPEQSQSDRSDLEDEHVIPYFLAGYVLLKKSSCRKCAKITSAFEGSLSDTVFLSLRKKAKLQSRTEEDGRSKRKKDKMVYAIISENGVDREVKVSPTDIPNIAPFLSFGIAGIQSNALPSNEIDPKKISVECCDVSRVSQIPAPTIGQYIIHVDWRKMLQLYAKIALGVMRSLREFEGFEPLVQSSILTGDYVSYFVGEGKVNNDLSADPSRWGSPVSSEIMVLPHDPGSEYLVMHVHIFYPLNPKCLAVFVGRRPNVKATLHQQYCRLKMPDYSRAPTQPPALIRVRMGVG